jgi:hypothetical protein
MPLYENCGRNFDVPAKLFGGMSSQEQAVEECSFALREVEIVPCFIFRSGGRRKGRVGYSLHQRSKTDQRRIKDGSKTKGNSTGSFNGVKWLGREITWFCEV